MRSSLKPRDADGAELPLEGAEFARLLDALGPFEAQPHIAVAVSGGRDSLALAALTQDWVAARGGRLSALIVDHGLRAKSPLEAANAASTLQSLGVAAHVLSWNAAKPSTGLAEAARQARYRLLQDWCTAQGVLHLLLAHQRDDQAETLVMRWARASGADGLAAMASVVEVPGLRLLRPLLDVPRARLTATLQARGLRWADDPTNGNLRYLRPRLRQRLSPELTGQVAAFAGGFAADRAAIERRLAAVIAECVTVQPEGWLQIDSARFATLPREIGLRVLGRAVWTIGGATYPPRHEALLRAADALAQGRATTAGGCRLAPQREWIAVVREAGAIRQAWTVPASPDGVILRWDRRFDLLLQSSEAAEVRALGEAGRQEVLHQPNFAGPLRQAITALPAMVARALPALWSLDFSGSAAHLLALSDGGRAGGWPATVPGPGTGRLVAEFRPERPLAPAPHALVLPGQRLI